MSSTQSSDNPETLSDEAAPAKPVAEMAEQIKREVAASFARPATAEYNESGLDYRLITPNVASMSVLVELADGSSLRAEAFSLSRWDVVLRAELDRSEVPDSQPVHFAVQLHDGTESERFDGVLHWHNERDGFCLLAIFASQPIPDTILANTTDDRRGEIRFPLSLPVMLRGGGYRNEARLIDYSLNGVGLAVSRPLELDRRYEASVRIGGRIVKFPMICCWNVRGGNGYVSGCGLKNLEGCLLASRNFDCDPTEADAALTQPLNHMHGGVEATGIMAAPFDRLRTWYQDVYDVIDEKLDGDKPVISRTAILILVGMLLGMGMKTEGVMRTVAYLYAGFGLIAWIGLEHASKIREAEDREETASMKRGIVERRLDAHLPASPAEQAPSAE